MCMRGLRLKQYVRNKYFLVFLRLKPTMTEKSFVQDAEYLQEEFTNEIVSSVFKLMYMVINTAVERNKSTGWCSRLPLIQPPRKATARNTASLLARGERWHFNEIPENLFTKNVFKVSFSNISFAANAFHSP